MRSWLFYLLSVPYIKQKEIKLCKKLIYSYSTRLAFHMPGFYLLTIFNYYIVATVSRELSSIYFRDLKGGTPTSNILGELLPVTILKCRQNRIKLNSVRSLWLCGKKKRPSGMSCSLVSRQK